MKKIDNTIHDLMDDLNSGNRELHGITFQALLKATEKPVDQVYVVWVR